MKSTGAFDGARRRIEVRIVPNFETGAEVTGRGKNGEGDAAVF